MKLVAEILTGTLFYVEVNQDATVGDLKKEIAEQENLPCERLILMLDSDERPLLNDNEVALRDYGVEDSSHIYIFFEPVDDVDASAPDEPSSPPSVESNQQPHDDDVAADADDDDADDNAAT